MLESLCSLGAVSRSYLSKPHCSATPGAGWGRQVCLWCQSRHPASPGSHEAPRRPACLSSYLSQREEARCACPFGHGASHADTRKALPAPWGRRPAGVRRVCGAVRRAVPRGGAAVIAGRAGRGCCRDSSTGRQGCPRPAHTHGHRETRRSTPARIYKHTRTGTHRLLTEKMRLEASACI